MRTSYAHAGETPDSTIPPAPPAEDDDGGGDHRDEHKLLLMYALSFFIWARIPPLSGRTQLPLYYVQTLLEELEAEGMVELGYRAWPRWMHGLERVMRRRTPLMGHDLTAALTGEDEHHPRLVALKEEDEADRRHNLRPSRLQKLFVFGLCAIPIGAAIVEAAAPFL